MKNLKFNKIKMKKHSMNIENKYRELSKLFFKGFNYGLKSEINLLKKNFLKDLKKSKTSPLEYLNTYFYDYIYDMISLDTRDLPGL